MWAVVEPDSSTHDGCVITRKGGPAAVLISPDDLEALVETIAILADPAAVADIEQARLAISQGDRVDSADITVRHRS